MRRKTSNLERYMFFFGRLYPLNFAFKLTVSECLEEARIKDALTRLSRRHPIIFAHQEYTEGKKMDMVFPDEPPLPVSHIAEESEWQRILLGCMAKEFKPLEGPFFTLDYRYTENHTELFFTFQHGASDGIAAVYVISDFLKIYQEMEIAIPDVPVMPVLYDVLLAEVDEEMKKRPEPGWKSEPPPAGHPFEMPPHKVSDYFLRTYELSREGTAHLGAEAKKNGQTVHSWLGALILKASADIFGKEGMERTIQCPVDFRQYIQEEYRTLAGVHNGIVKVKVDCALELPAAAQRIKEGIQESRTGYKDIEEYYQWRDSFDSVPDPESLMMDFTVDPVDFDFSFSNLGRTAILEDYRGLKVLDFYGPIFTAVNGETVIGVNTTNGELKMSIIFDKNIPKAPGYRALAGQIREILHSFES